MTGSWLLTLLALTSLTVIVISTHYDPTFCGDTPAPIVQHKIMGGKDADPDHFRNVVSIFYLGRFLCTASLIAPGVVLTAAHCFMDKSNPNTFLETVCGDDVTCLSQYLLVGEAHEKCQSGFLNANRIRQLFTVVVGAHPLDSKAPHFGIIDIDPSYARFYHRGCFQHDIAILKIADTEDAPYSCILPRSFVNLKGFVETMSVGWGADPMKGMHTHNELQLLSPGVVRPRDDCFALTNGDMAIDGLCVQEYQDKNTCEGDSGGPLLTYHDYSRYRHRLVTLGPLSSGTKCSRLRDNYAPGGATYTRLDFYNAFLDSVLNITGLYDNLTFSADVINMQLTI